MEKIALLPGGFKPPHAGHYNMAKWLASNTDANTVVIKVGAKERDGITRNISLKLWNLYRITDSDPLAKKLTILPSNSNSPVKDVYDFVEQDAPENSIIYLGMGEKDMEDARFKNIGKFADPKGITFETTLVPPQSGGVSGTKMREFIKNGDKESFQEYIPEHLTQEQKDQAWEMVSSLEELMYGTMNNQEKAKHAKNLKRLKKDMSKQGDQYMEVPNYLKGTLKRKLYHEDLYDPNDHYRDFAKTNDPNPKKPTSSNYKYRDGGIKSPLYRKRNFGENKTINESTAIIHDKFIPLEVMDTPELQIQGMMGRNKLKGGMVFPYDNFSKREFHMQNCKIPLDIIFIDNNKINKIDHSAPPCKGGWCPKYSGKADTVLELPGGYCKKHNVNVGDHVGINLYDIPEPEETKNHNRRWVVNEVDKKELTKLDTFADKQLDPVDVDLTSNHFFDRLNDPRNNKEISNAELIGFFKRLGKKKKELFDFLSKFKEIVASDDRTDINIPFLNQANKIIAKTILRKKDFQTSNPKLSLERDLSDKEERIAQSLPDKEFKKRYGKDWKSVKIATATKIAKNEGDTYEKMAAKGKKRGNLKQGTVRKRLGIPKDKKIPISLINKEISRIKKMDNPSEKNKKYLKALNLAKTLKTTTHKENINEADPKKGTGKKPKGSGRRLYTDENPKDTVKVKFSTRQDIVDTLSKKSFKSKSHARKSQIINLIHQRVRAALGRTKDPQKKKRLKSAFEYIKKRKEASKRKTKRMKKEAALTKNWWKEIINEILLTEGGAAGHMAHPFNLSNVNSGKDLKNIFNKAAESLRKNPGAVKIDGVNSSIRLVDLEGKKQFAMDRGSKKPLDMKGITKADLEDRFKPGHGMIKVGGEVLDMFNEALPTLENDLKKLGAWDDSNILFNMEYVSGKTNVQDYGSNFIAIHGLNKIESKEVQGKRGPLTKRISTEISYDKNALQSLLDNLAPIAKKNDFEVYGSVPTEMIKEPNFGSALSKNYTVKFNDEEKSQTLDNWLNELTNIPEEDFIFIDVNGTKKKVGAVSKQVYQAILNGGNVDELFGDDKDKAIEGFTTYLATEKLGDEILKVLDSPMGSVENHEGVVIRDEKISNIPFKITGKFILGGMASDF